MYSPLEQFEILYVLTPKTSCLMFDNQVNYSISNLILNFFSEPSSKILDDDFTNKTDQELFLMGIEFQNFIFDSIFFELVFDCFSDFSFREYEDLDTHFANAYTNNHTIENYPELNNFFSMSRDFFDDYFKAFFFKQLNKLVSKETFELDLISLFSNLTIIDADTKNFSVEQYADSILDAYHRILLDYPEILVYLVEQDIEAIVDLFEDSMSSSIYLEDCDDCDAYHASLGLNSDSNQKAPQICSMFPNEKLPRVIEKSKLDENNPIFHILQNHLSLIISNKPFLDKDSGDDKNTGFSLVFIIDLMDKKELSKFSDVGEAAVHMVNSVLDLGIIFNNINIDELDYLINDFVNALDIEILGLDYINSDSLIDLIFNSISYAFNTKPEMFHFYSSFLYYFKYLLIGLLHPFFILIGNISTNLLFTLLTLSSLIILMFLLFSLQFFLVPRNAHLYMHSYYLFIKSIIIDLIIHPTGKQYYYQLIAFLFVLLNLLNLYGLIPYTFVLTSQFSFTFFCSFIFFSALNFTGITVHGLHLFSLFFPSGAPIFISPLLVVIEFISYFARVFSLAIRLFANITAGHILLKILSWFTWSMLDIFFASILSTLIITVLWVLEFFISVLQAYVFTILICIYLNDVLNLH